MFGQTYIRQLCLILFFSISSGQGEKQSNVVFRKSCNYAAQMGRIKPNYFTGSSGLNYLDGNGECRGQVGSTTFDPKVVDSNPGRAIIDFSIRKMYVQQHGKHCDETRGLMSPARVDQALSIRPNRFER